MATRRPCMNTPNDPEYTFLSGRRLIILPEAAAVLDAARSPNPTSAPSVFVMIVFVTITLGKICAEH